jgi:hypothetical protein
MVGTDYRGDSLNSSLKKKVLARVEFQHFLKWIVKLFFNGKSLDKRTTHSSPMVDTNNRGDPYLNV